MTVEFRSLFVHTSKLSSALMLTALLAALTTTQGAAATLVVSNTSASGPGSLQQAILDANATNGLDTIIFQIPGSGVHTISPTGALPAISDPVVIDGTTQPGYAGTPLIEINGASAGDNAGLRLYAGGSTIRGLAINQFAAQGLLLQGGGTNQVQGNFIGTDPSGTIARRNSLQGIWINGSSGNLIGGTDATNRNVISGNGDVGVYLGNSASNVLQGNFIGTTASGTAALGNASDGIYVINGPGNLIGGTAPGARNVISGNGSSGVYLNGSGATANLVQGNYIGTDLTGSVAVRNAADGLAISGAPGNTIGGEVAGAGNILSGNSQVGVNLIGPGADSNLIQGNSIGTDVSGRLALGNLYSGINVFSGNSNLIGGTAAAARNVVSANKQAGVYLSTSSVGNLVQGNYIGVDATGTNALGNAINGVSIQSASSNMIGGPIAGARNIISGNTNHGIEVFSAGATANVIQGNYIGTDVRGLVALANKFCGIYIQSPGNTIGGTASGAGNLISGNSQYGIYLTNAANNLVQGNWVGTAVGGTTGLGNVWAGVGIFSAPANIVGGTVPGAGNLLSANGDAGVYLSGSGTTGNLIQGNTIGADVTGTLALGNTLQGIYVEFAPTNMIGGAVLGAGNLISANNVQGILLTNASGNVIQGNLIGTKADGVSNLGNVFHGVELQVGANNNLIGGVGAGNRIAWSQPINAGVRIRDGSTNNAILCNAIFSNSKLGIDLGPFTVNANISCEIGGNAKANMAQNYPALTQAVSGNGTGIRGTFNSRPNATFLLQFFSNPACNALGYGDGQFYLGQTTVVTSNNCNSSFVVSLPVQVPIGYVIAATATDSANNTSEFSACVPVTAVPAVAVNPLVTNHQVALAWTNTTTGFVLLQTGSLTPPIQWTTVTNAPVNTNGQFVVTLSDAVGNRFYALRFQ
jgi:parallel beta-helix repeat protein